MEPGMPTFRNTSADGKKLCFQVPLSIRNGPAFCCIAMCKVLARGQERQNSSSTKSSRHARGAAISAKVFAQGVSSKPSLRQNTT